MRFLALCPRIHHEDGRLVATTAWRLRVLLLGTVLRTVIVDRDQRSIAVRSRYLWVFRRNRRIPFSSVQSVTYGYEDWSPDSMLAYAHDSFDWFTVGLRLSDDSEITLFNFLGEGTFSNSSPIPDWMYAEDYALDLAGSQESESRAFVDVVAKLVGVKVTPPRCC